LPRTFSIITTCKGRLDHLKESLPAMVAQGAKEVIVVDYSCPDGTGDYVAVTYPDVRLVRVEGEQHFSNWKARNAGAEVATGDMLRFAVTRMLEKQLAKAAEQPPPVPLLDRAPAVCQLFAALAQCRFGADKQGMNAYRAGLMGLLMPQTWSPFPDDLPTPAQLDGALAALSQVHPTGKRTFSEGMARVVAVGGKLTVPQVDLLRAVCTIIDCPLPVLPADLVYDDNAVPELAPRRVAAHASAR